MEVHMEVREDYRKKLAATFKSIMSPTDMVKWCSKVELEIMELRTQLQHQHGVIRKLKKRAKRKNNWQSGILESESKKNKLSPLTVSLQKRSFESDPDAEAEEQALDYCQDNHDVWCTKC